MSLKSNTNFYGINFLKVSILLAIAILHCNEFIFFENSFPLGWSSPIFQLSSYYARTFAIGGQALISIIYLLFGLNNKSRSSLFKISLFSILGQVILSLVFKIVEWDIYSFIFFSNILIISTPFFYKKNNITILFSFLVIFISPKYFTSIFSSNSALSLLTGNYALSSSGPWPILPWFFFALFFYQMGLRIRLKNIFEEWSRYESFIWPVLFCLSLPQLGHYFNLPVGPNYYHFAFYQDSYIFLSNFLPYLLIMRLSFLRVVQDKLITNKFMHIISSSYWCRHLGLTYMLSVAYLGIGMNLREYFFNSPWIFDFYFFSVILIPEFLSRIFVKLKLKFNVF
jgi:hypothetical protein